jgi:hypothetical protein
MSLPSACQWELNKEVFAECYGPGTRQRSKLCRVPPSALSKETNKGARWWPRCRVSPNTLGKGNLFAECHLVHSAKVSSPLPVTVTTTFLCRVPSDTRQSICRVPNKKYSVKKLLPMYNSPSSLCRVSHSAKLSPSVF